MGLGRCRQVLLNVTPPIKKPSDASPRAKNILYVNCDFNEKSGHTLYFLLFEVRNHFLLIAACAAAKRAIGTRKGEQDT